MNDEHSLIAYFSKGKLAGLALLGSAMVAASVALIVFDFGRGPLVVQRFWGVLGALFFGAALLMILRRLFDQRAALEIDDIGIIDRRVADQKFRWQEIERAWISELRASQFSTHRYVSLQLREPHSMKVNLWRSAFRSFTANRGFGDLAVNAVGVTSSFEQIKVAIGARIPIEGA